MCKKINHRIKNRRLARHFKQIVEKGLPSVEQAELITFNRFNTRDNITLSEDIFLISEPPLWGSVRCSGDSCDGLCVNLRENIQFHDWFTMLDTNYVADGITGNDWNGKPRMCLYTGASMESREVFQPNGVYTFLIQLPYYGKMTRQAIWTLHHRNMRYREQDVIERFHRPDVPIDQIDVTTHYGTSQRWKDRKMFKNQISKCPISEHILCELEFCKDNRIIERVNSVEVFNSTMADMHHPFNIIISNIVDTQAGDPKGIYCQSRFIVKHINHYYNK